MKVTSISLPDEMKDRLEYEARRNSRSLSGEIVYRLRQTIEPQVREDIERFKVLVSGPRGD